MLLLCVFIYLNLNCKRKTNGKVIYIVYLYLRAFIADDSISSYSHNKFILY